VAAQSNNVSGEGTAPRRLKRGDLKTAPLVVVVRVLLLGLAVAVFAHVLLLGFGFRCSVSHSRKGRQMGI